MKTVRSEGEIIGAKLRKRAKLMHLHGASRDLIGVMVDAANRLARLGRENELLKRKIEERGLFGPLSGVAIGLAPFCKYHDCHIARTIDGGFRAVRIGEQVPAGWRVMFDVDRGTKAAMIFAKLKECASSLDSEPVGANRATAARKAKKSTPKAEEKAYSSFTVRLGPDQAERVAELVVGKVDLYRVRDGAIRVMKADKPCDGEFLGRFDEGATWQDIQEALE